MWLANDTARTKPGTASNRFRALQQFFKFAVEEEEIDRSPMERMHRPRARSSTSRTSGTQRSSACSSTPACRAEPLGLRVSDIDFDQDVALVIGKGRKGRACPFGSKTGLALGRYLRLRSGHPFAASPALWLGKKGR